MRAGIHNPYWDSLGGGERYTAAVVRWLLDHHWQVDIAWPQDLSSHIRDRFGIDISAANFIPRLSTLDYRLVFWVSDGSLPLSLAKKTIIHFQFPFQNVHGSRPLNLLKSRFYIFVANSRFTKSVVDREFHIHSRVVYPPIDTAKFQPAVKDNLIFYIGRFSRLTQLKGQETLITAFKNISARIPGWKLVLAGGVGVGTTDSDLTDLQSLASGFPIEFMFNPSFAEIRSLCSRGKIFWSASGFSADAAVQTEHFGITVVEAMAAGAVPVITNLGGHREIVTPETGYLWNRPDEMAKYTLNLVRHESRLGRLSRASQIRSKIFDTAVFNRNLAKII